VFKLFLAAALGVAFIATPAVSDAPAWDGIRSRPLLHNAPANLSALPVAALLSGLVLVAISNRRRNLQKVLC
jgi:hypothetical protein